VWLGEIPIFRRKISPRSSGRRLSQANIQQYVTNLLEDTGDMFLRNVGLSQNYKALQPRKQYSSAFQTHNR
jgi:hypothetical protein